MCNAKRGWLHPNRLSLFFFLLDTIFFCICLGSTQQKRDGNVWLEFLVMRLSVCILYYHLHLLYLWLFTTSQQWYRLSIHVYRAITLSLLHIHRLSYTSLCAGFVMPSILILYLSCTLCSLLYSVFLYCIVCETVCCLARVCFSWPMLPLQMRTCS